MITVNTAELFDAHGRRALLSPINSGSTIYRPVPRGLDTFLSLDAYPYEERRKLRGAANAVAELAFDYSVPDMQNFVERAERRRAGLKLGVLFERRPRR